MAITIREADLGDPRDAAAVVAIIDAYARDEFGGGSPLPADVRERLVAGLRAHPTTLVLLAESSDVPGGSNDAPTGANDAPTGANDAPTGSSAALVGVAVCFFGYSTFAARPLVNVHDLAVLPAARSRGVGRALLAAVEARARARGCCKLTLEVLDDNRRARGLYASVGFSDVAVGSSTFTRFLGKPLEGEQ
jgi:ribosomal protein S18 acetylase RimI-like enzyme